MTDSLQLTAALRHHPDTRNYFMGCCPSDGIKTSSLFPYCWIVNTDESHQPGQHWVVVNVVAKERVEYFDSLAHWPAVENIQEFLDGFNTVVHLRAGSTLQSPRSTCCGKYALYFLLQRYHQPNPRSFVQIVHHLNTFATEPDKIVQSYVNRRFKRIFSL